MDKDTALDLALEALTVLLDEWTPARQAQLKGMEAVTAIKQARALDKKAENARELGLDYEPVQELPFGVGGGLVAIKTLLGRDPCVHANTAIQMIDAILNTPPAQPAPVQTIIGSYLEKDNSQFKFSDYESDGRRYPAVPDAFGTREGEHPQYIQGWNDCRAEMLRGNT